MDTIIWHNPRCSKSRQTLALLQDHGIEPEVRLYLEAPPSSEELADVIAKLGIGPWALLRRCETVGQGAQAQQRQRYQNDYRGNVPTPDSHRAPRGDQRRWAALGRPPETTLLDYV